MMFNQKIMSSSVTLAARAANGGEIALELHAGLQLVGFAPAGHRLRKAAPALACVDESAVVIAVAG